MSRLRQSSSTWSACSNADPGSLSIRAPVHVLATSLIKTGAPPVGFKNHVELGSASWAERVSSATLDFAPTFPVCTTLGNTGQPAQDWTSVSLVRKRSPVRSRRGLQTQLELAFNNYVDVVATSHGDQAKLQTEVLALRRQVQVLERQIKRARWSPQRRSAFLV